MLVTSHTSDNKYFKWPQVVRIWSWGALVRFQVGWCPTSCNASSSTCIWSKAFLRTGWSLRTVKPGDFVLVISGYWKGSKEIKWSQHDFEYIAPQVQIYLIPILIWYHEVGSCQKDWQSNQGWLRVSKVASLQRSHGFKSSLWDPFSQVPVST